MVLAPQQLHDLKQAIISLNSGFSVQDLEQFRNQEISPLLVNGFGGGLKMWLEIILKQFPELGIINGILAMIYYEEQEWLTAQQYAVLAKKTLGHQEYWQELFNAAALHECTEEK